MQLGFWLHTVYAVAEIPPTVAGHTFVSCAWTCPPMLMGHPHYDRVLYETVLPYEIERMTIELERHGVHRKNIRWEAGKAWVPLGDDGE